MEAREYVVAKLQKWRDNIEAGKKGFELLVGSSKGYYYHSGSFSSPVDTVIACTMNGTGITSCHQWDKGKALPDDGEFTAIIKKREKMLVTDKGSGCFASGMSKADEADVTRALLYFRCGGIATFVAASSNMPLIHAVDYVPELEEDPLQAVLHDLLEHLTGKEATNDG